MRSRQIILGIVTVCILAIIGGFAWTWRPALDPISTAQTPPADKQAIQHGAGLAAIGNCNACHTADAGEPYAGGRPIPTPFGTIFADRKSVV